MSMFGTVQQGQLNQIARFFGALIWVKWSGQTFVDAAEKINRLWKLVEEPGDE